MNRFRHTLLGFECAIPPGWVELPVAWARKASLSASATSEKLGALLKASSDEPFLNLSLPQTDPFLSVPMIRCTSKPQDAVQRAGGPDEVIDAAIARVEGAYPDFRVVQRLSPYLVAGASGACARMNMTVLNEQGTRFPCQSELIVLQTARCCLIMGLTGPADPDEGLSADFELFVRSIRLS